ncbi:MAG: hypothetical protein IPJ89_05495 [Candidatus Iainarchaeum archaeon]|uniref:Transcription regulator TrmB N-terminal domain-containing protein n=1 Tax=Candidatus Iainarchaeum sp. TaxID=3101447 RepID=A0A7T9I1M6_9ARCH|nr:MAG: hypothetical protein IPJ89_05495 [Candidatus Diapherotrites archaeon]
MIQTRVLEELGLSKREIQVYVTLLKLGQTTTTPLIRSSHIHPSKVYETLDRLIGRGLASYTVKSNKKYFQASDPQSFVSIIQSKKQELQQREKSIHALIPELKQLQTLTESKINIQIYEGIAGLKNVYERIYDRLGKGETQYIIGAPKLVNEKMEGFLLDWHKRRIEKGIHCKYIYNSDARKYGEKRTRMDYSEVRYLPSEIITPMWIEIFGNTVSIGHIKKTGAVMLLIEDKEIAQGYLEYFSVLWKVSTK